MNKKLNINSILTFRRMTDIVHTDVAISNSRFVDCEVLSCLLLLFCAYKLMRRISNVRGSLCINKITQN